MSESLSRLHVLHFSSFNQNFIKAEDSVAAKGAEAQKETAKIPQEATEQ